MLLKMCSNRGVKVYPTGPTRPDCVDHYRCRFLPRQKGAEVTDHMLADLLERIGAKHHWMHLEKMQEFDGKAAYTNAQGED
jgi:isocitrate dehydrogenase